MLILSLEHPHFARCQAFAQSQGISVTEVGAASEDSSFEHLRSDAPRVALALPAQELSVWLAAWARTPHDARPRELVCIGESFDDDALAAAWDEAITPQPIISVDHNLSTGEVLAWSLVWGAAVPLFERVVHAKEKGLVARARAAAQAVQDVRKDADVRAEWSLHGQEDRTSVGGFIQCDTGTLPRALREVGSDDQGLLSANAERWSRWTPVFDAAADTVTLRGKGQVMLNGRVMRVGATDMFYLRRLEPIALRFVGELSAARR